jgi:hypothetical protein
MGRLQELIAELRRRRVFRALVGWGIASFAVLQVVEPVLHAYHLPEWTLTLVVTGLVAGFPATATLSWLFDFTRRGVTRTPARPVEGTAGAAPPAGKVVLSRRSVALVAACVVAALAAGLWAVRRESRIRWALEEGLPQVAELVEQNNYPAAVALAEQVEQVIPRNPRLLQLWPEMSRLQDVETVPDGAEVRVKLYGAPDTEWRLVGSAPLKGLRLRSRSTSGGWRSPATMPSR